MNDSRLYTIELLYKDVPQLDSDALLAKLQTGLGRVQPMTQDSKRPSNNTNLLAFAFVDQGQPVPPQVMIGTGFPANAEHIALSLQQSWKWSEAKQVAPQCRASIVINEFMAHYATRQTRLEMIRHTTLAVHDMAPCQAVNWLPAQQIVHPSQVVKAAQNGDPLFPGVNVRLFNIQNQQPGETLMDSVGLSAFGLPDLQCHFVRLDLNAVANLLYSYAYYLFEKGDVIEDGNTVQGTTPNSKWVCHHETALISPEREVLDINPGHPFAAGNRD